MGQKQINVTVHDDARDVAGYLLHNAMRTSEGNYRGVIYAEAEEVEEVEEMLEMDDNVVEYM